MSVQSRQQSRQQSQDFHVHDDDRRSDSKRRSEEPSSGQARAKRNRYISLACNECKRRKIKCNGETPCHRCGNLALECLYAPNCCSNGFKDTEDFRQMNAHIESLQEQVDNLFASLGSLRNRSNSSTFSTAEHDRFHQLVHQNPSAPTIQCQGSLSPPSPTATLPRFKGPTSSAFNFDVARSSLQTMGVNQTEHVGGEALLGQAGAIQGPYSRPQSSMTQLPTQSPKDPLWRLQRDEVVRLCRLFDDEIGTMSPMLDIEKTISRANKLYDFMESAIRVGLVSREIERGDSFHDEQTNVLRMVLATSLTVEGGGESELGRALYESVRAVTQSSLWEPINLNGLILLVVLAQYHFHCDDEPQAYRVIGLAARLSFEKGLHRSDTLATAFENDDDRDWAVRLFWSIYLLDRRWSTGTGMPFAIQDADIDPHLPQPDVKAPYLRVMVSFGRIASKVFRSAANWDSTDERTRTEIIEYIDSKIDQWIASIPENLKYQPLGQPTDREPPSRSIYRLRVLLYLRGHHVRIMAYRPILHSATSIMRNRAYSQRVVDAAKEIIRVLTILNQTSDIYSTNQAILNWFLVSSLAVLFLAVSHAPAEFSAQVRDEFYMALDIVKGFSTSTIIAKRLWKAIKGLKEIAPRLGLISRQSLLPPPLPPHIHPDTHSDAAVAMAGLAGHQIERYSGLQHVDASALVSYSRSSQPSTFSQASSPMDGHQMSYELTNLFEAVGRYDHGLFVQPGMVGDGMGEYVAVDPGNAMLYGNEEEFATIMKGLF